MANDPTCTNCDRPFSEHARPDYLCPAAHNDGDDDMSFITMPVELAAQLAPSSLPAVLESAKAPVDQSANKLAQCKDGGN